MLPPERTKRIKTKPCSICGSPLPIYSRVTRRICAICSKCPTCGSASIRISGSDGTVVCGSCRNDWDSTSEFEAAVRKATSRKCKVCSTKMSGMFPDLYAHLCQAHMLCPICKTPSLTSSKIKAYGAPLYKCAHCGMIKTSRALESAIKAS